MIKEKLYSFKETVTNNPSFTLKEQLGYSGGIFGNCMGQDSVHTFSEQFFRDYLGINADRMTLMGVILSAAGFIYTPIIGNFLDAPTKPGKKAATKRFLGMMPIPFAVASMLLFIVPTAFGPLNSYILRNSASEEAAVATRLLINFIWGIALRFIFGVVDAFYDLSLNTLSLRMTNNPNDRKNFYTVATLASSLGSMLPGWVIPIVVDKMPTPEKEKWAYFFVALIFCIVGVVMMYAPYFTLEEKIKVVAKPKKTVIQWDKETFAALIHNRPFVVTEVGTFFEQIRQMSYSLLNYIYKKTFDDYKMKSIIDVISGTLSYVGLAAVPALGRKFSARTILSGGFAYTGIFYSIMALLAAGADIPKLRKRRYIVGVLIGLAGMPNNALSASKKIIVGDSTDYMEWYSEKHFGTPIHSEGLLAAVQGWCGTIFSLIKEYIYNSLFKLVGYQENTQDKLGKTIEAVQTPETLKGLYLMFAFCGIVGNFLASASYLFDNYTGEHRKEVYAELLEIRAARAAENPAPAEDNGESIG